MPSTMQILSNAVRGAIVAPPGRKLVIADLSNIEGRVLAWLAGEEWKLAAFREFDAGVGPDLYKLAYARSFRIRPEDVTKDQRQIGKVMELSLGYQGGVGAFVTMALNYGLDLVDLARIARPTLPAWALDEAAKFLQWRCAKAYERHEKRLKRGGVAFAESKGLLDKALTKARLGLDENVFTSIDALKRLWRAAHPKVVALWADIETQAIVSVLPGGDTRTPVGRLDLMRTGNWLRIVLPSGRSLSYAAPRVDEGGKLSYMGMNQYSRQWSRLSTYGGKLVENVTQAAARDVMAWSMPRVEAAGYEIVLTVHDELVTEAPDSPEFNGDHLAALLSAGEEWTTGLPLAAAGHETHRYRKE